jgi:hypothetical protein
MGGPKDQPEFIRLANERENTFALHALNESLRAGSREKFQAVFVGDMSLGLTPEWPHVLFRR